MANWAVVIGINAYEYFNAPLKGPVSDASVFCEWLLRGDGGNVPKNNIFFLAEPKEECPPNLKVWARPTKDNIILTLNRVVEKAGGACDRFYFYFSGHGIRSQRQDGLSVFEDSIVTVDFSPELTSNSLSIESVLNFFALTNFNDQFYFIDGCREMHHDGRFLPGRMPTNPKLEDKPGLVYESRSVQQFVLFATSPGSRAADIQRNGKGAGAFSDSLMKGLNGVGSAKAYDAEQTCYVVRWDLLCNFVRSDVEKRQIDFRDHASTADKDVSYSFQIPQKAGKQGVYGRDSNPILATYKDSHFQNEVLDIVIDPTEAAPTTTLQVREAGEVDFVFSKQGMASHLLSIQLPPKPYAIVVSAPGYRPKKKKWLVELFQASKIEVGLDLMRGGTIPAVVSSSRVKDSLGFTVKPDFPQIGNDTIDDFRPTPDFANLVVTAADPLTLLEVCESGGRMLRREHTRKLDFKGGKPGFYCVKLRTPEGNDVEEMVELQPGETATITMRGPRISEAPVITERLVESLGFRKRPDNTIWKAGYSPIVSVDLPTLLIVIAHLGLSEGLPSMLQDTLGLNGPHHPAKLGDATSRVYVLFGNEGWATDEGDGLYDVRVLFHGGESDTGKNAAPSSYSRAKVIPGIGDFSIDVRDEGLHWLTIHLKGRPPAAIPVIAKNGRDNLFIFSRRLNGDVKICRMWSSVCDPHETNERFRLMGLIQRYLDWGKNEFIGDPLTLINQQPIDPIGRLIGCYLLLGLRREKEVGEVTLELIRDFPMMSDSYVLHAAYLEAGMDIQESIKAYTAAMDIGIPIHSAGVSRLLNAITRYKIAHKNESLLRRVSQSQFAGCIWTAFSDFA